MNLSIPDKTLEEAGISADDLIIEIAVYLYDTERLSFGQAKSLSGLNYLAFQKELSKRNVFVKYDISDIEKDLKNLRELRGKLA